MKYANTARRRTQRGSAMLESALVLTTFIFMLLGIVEFGRMVYAFNFVSMAAREGSRWASVRGSACSTPATNATITTYVDQWTAGLDASKVTVATTWTPDNNPGSSVQVKVTYNWSPVVGILFPTSSNFSSVSNMVILQ